MNGYFRIILLLVLVHTSAQSQVTVIGAGSNVANGEYTYDTVLNGHNRYEKFDEFANCAVEYYGRWEIFCTQFSPWIQFTYFVGDDTCDPGELDPPPDGWELGTNATSPVPMLSGDLCSTLLSIDSHIPSDFHLEIIGTMPNPFNPVCTIEYRLSMSDNIEVSIFNMKGELVSTLWDGQQGAGTHNIVWDAADQPSGVYFIHISSGSEGQARKILLLK